LSHLDGSARNLDFSAFMVRRRVAVAVAIAFLNASLALPDDRRLLQAGTLLNVLQFGPVVESFAAPSLPAFASPSGDEAIVGSVIPSHVTASNGNSSWAVWNGALKAYQLDSNGNIPTVPLTAASMAAPTAVPTGIPKPVLASIPVQGFPDESNPDDTRPGTRRLIWNASRVLGYTDPVLNLTGAAASRKTAATSANAPAISVWPGRRMIWGNGTGPTVPLTRQDFLPNTATCAGTNKGNCFHDLMTAMGLSPGNANDITRATRTVQFLRGGKTSPSGAACSTTTLPCPGSRDEVLTELQNYGTVTANSQYSYFYQDDTPPGNPPSAQTDGATSPPGYSHKLGDIFHSEATVLLPPKYFQFISSDLTPRKGSCGPLADCSYNTFRTFHRYRRKVVFVGANDGFLHAFDAGVYDRDDDPGRIGPTPAHPFNDAFDLGTGREIFAYAPKGVMPATADSPPKGFPSLLNFPPQVQYFVDGSPAAADMFVDTGHNGTPSDGNRTWKTVLVGGLRQGGRFYFALDVTQPDKVGPDGRKTADRDSSPDCLDGGPGCAAAYPTVLWEMTDDCTLDSRTCIPNSPPIGETWSRPVLGRIRVARGSGSEDRYVAIFGGGFDPSFTPGIEVNLDDTAIRGRSIDIVNVETGKVIYKATAGVDDGGNIVHFAPMPATPAVADVNGDGYLDLAYIGDLNGRMWRLDLSSFTCNGCDAPGENLTSANPPFLLYDALKGGSGFEPIQPVFLEAGLIFLCGGPTPTLGVAFGTGDRAELLQKNKNINRFTFVVDPGRNAITFHDTNLVNITPSCTTGQPCDSNAGAGPAGTIACDDPGMTNCGYFLAYASASEKATSTVFSTGGKLSFLTFTPTRFSSTTACSVAGASFRYSINALAQGRGGYAGATPTGTYADYRQRPGNDFAAATQSQSQSGVMIDTVFLSSGGINQQNTPVTLKSMSESWKEQ
jgi:Tfp pilus tip-associated adhesin PilY1